MSEPGSMGKEKVLIVDDDPTLLRLLNTRLTLEGYAVVAAGSGEEALAKFAAVRPDVVITDLQMGGVDGMALFASIHRADPTLPVIILTAHGTIPAAVSAAQRGVFDYLTKPVEGEALLETMRRALALGGRSPADDDGDWRSEIISRSPAMADLLSEARQVAGGDAAILITGASGTGKELLARAIHRASRRKNGAFVAVNCGAIPEPLLESELFGHVKGAFTGAHRDHAGLFQAANGGTLFLDEIGDMPLALQVKLLRVLQEKQVRPVGSTQSHPADARVISATHRDVAEAIAAGRFREDLYYRINVVSVHLPALAERREDIPLLAGHFLSLLAARYGKKLTGFAPDSLELLLKADWPGNVRQLYNAVEQCVARASSGIIPATLAQRAIQNPDAALASFDEARRGFEREYLVRLLRMTEGNVTQAAKLARRNRSEFYSLLRRHLLDPTDFKQHPS
jgi:two-component system response regulator GlrR